MTLQHVPFLCMHMRYSLTCNILLNIHLLIITVYALITSLIIHITMPVDRFIFITHVCITPLHILFNHFSITKQTHLKLVPSNLNCVIYST